MRVENSYVLLSLGALLLSVYWKWKGNQKRVYKWWGISTFFITSAFVLLVGYSLFHVFKFQYVYEHTSLELPRIYRLSALWAGKEGSFLLWAVIGVWMASFLLTKSIKTYSIFNGIVGLLLTMTFFMNPFKEMNEVVVNGLGLPEALQDPWMVVHPPLVFVGYTAMAILLAIGLGEKKDEAKKWIRLSMALLGLGIMTGSVWAYRALGWGGYWAWDPIENIALVPWLLLCGTAHDIAKNRVGKEEGEQVTKLECSFPFLIAALGTFLVRSGLLQNQSVHAYVSESAPWSKGVFLIMILGIIGVMGYSLYVQIKHGKKQKGLMRVFKTVTFLYAYVILLATLIPLVINSEVPKTFYNQLTIAYIMANSLLILALERPKINEKQTQIVVISALLSGLIVRVFECRSLGLTCVLWLVMIPLVGYSLTYNKSRDKYYYWTHVLLLVMLIGGLASAGMSQSFMESLQEPASFNFLMHLLEDHIVESTSEMTSMIIYTTKPLINLFWLGSFGMLALMLLKVMRRVDKK